MEAINSGLNIVKLSDLKSKVLALAKVQSSQDLKRCYPIARSFNLSYVKSWETLLSRFQANTKPEFQEKPTFHTLKSQVFKLAKVETTKQLKHNYECLKSLDFRHSSAWETALSKLTPLCTEQSQFEEWLESPPEEYKDLFKEIKIVSQSLGKAIEKGKQLGRDAEKMTDSIIELAQEAQVEIETMKQDIETQSKIRHQAEMN